MKRILYYSRVLLTACGMLQAQNWIHGKVVDKEERPVEQVCRVANIGFTYIDAVVTDSLRAFMLNKEAVRTIVVQHLLYERFVKNLDC